MAHIGYHAISAIPFIASGQVEIAIGCILPDVFWLHNEWKIQRNLRKGISPQETIDGLSEEAVEPYRIVHSFLFWAAALLIGVATPGLVLGVAIHLVIDLPTHRGRMQQQPLYPFTWRWPWVL